MVAVRSGERWGKIGTTLSIDMRTARWKENQGWMVLDYLRMTWESSKLREGVVI